MNVDTLTIAQRLQKVGVPKEAAEAHAEIVRDVIENNDNRAASKADLQEVAAQLRTEMSRMALTVIGALTVITALFEFLAR